MKHTHRGWGVLPLALALPLECVSSLLESLLVDSVSLEESLEESLGW